jgi:hypothetical protein
MGDIPIRVVDLEVINRFLVQSQMNNWRVCNWFKSVVCRVVARKANIHLHYRQHR